MMRSALPLSKKIGFRVLTFIISMALVTGVLELTAFLMLRSHSIRSGLGIPITGTSRQSMPVQIYSGLPAVQHDGYHLHKPGEYTRRQGDKTYTVKINRRGFRGGQFKQDAGSSVCRIICMGGSSTLGIESDENSTYPAFLVQTLTQMFPEREFEVINAGFSGMGIREIINLLEHEILPLRPDVVTLYTGINNMDREMERHERFQSQHRVVKGKLANALNRKSHAFNIVNGMVWRFQYRNMRKEFGLRELQEFETHLETLIQMVQTRSIHLVIIKQPLWISGYPQLQDSLFQQDIENRKRRGNVSREDLLWWFQSRLLGILDDTALSRELPIVDPMGEYFRDAERLFFDICHLTPEGNRRLAGHIAGAITEILQTKDAGPGEYGR